MRGKLGFLLKLSEMLWKHMKISCLKKDYQNEHQQDDKRFAEEIIETETSANYLVNS